MTKKKLKIGDIVFEPEVSIIEIMSRVKIKKVTLTHVCKNCTGGKVEGRRYEEETFCNCKTYEEAKKQVLKKLRAEKRRLNQKMNLIIKEFND